MILLITGEMISKVSTIFKIIKGDMREIKISAAAIYKVYCFEFKAKAIERIRVVGKMNFNILI